MPANGKDVEVVHGNPKRSAIELRVTKSTVSETRDGGARAVVTVTGAKLIEQKLAGEQVNVMTMGGRGGFGKCIEVTTKAGKEGKKFYRMKVKGARDLDSLVGLQVKVEQSQGELPGLSKHAAAKPGNRMRCPACLGKDGDCRRCDGSGWVKRSRAKGKEAAAGAD